MLFVAFAYKIHEEEKNSDMHSSSYRNRTWAEQCRNIHKQNFNENWSTPNNRNTNDHFVVHFMNPFYGRFDFKYQQMNRNHMISQVEEV